MRGRRATSSVTAFGLLVTLADIGLVTWARYRQAGPYTVSYQWINVATSFAGASQFQGFGIDISFRVDHVALAGAAAVTLSTLGVVVWHRFAGRGEAGPARIHAALALAVAAVIGVLVSGDLAALSAWWGLAGATTYLLLAHRWGSEAVGRASRLGLWLPFAGDVALWCAVAVLYSRFGVVSLDKLVAPGVLHDTYQAGLKSIGLAAVLFGVAALVRGGAFPFTAWQMALEAPPAIAAWAQAIWPVPALVLLVRVLPIFDSSGPEPYRIFAYLCAISIAGGILFSLLLNDLRRAVAWAGAAVVATIMLGLGLPGAVATSVAAILAVCLARPAAAGAAYVIALAMRSGDLADMGETWTRMRSTSIGFLAGALALALAPVPKAAALSAGGWRGQWLLAVALLLAGAALLRPYAAVAHGALRRRRAFEPTRVREVAGGAWGSALGLGVLGLAAVAAGFLPAWVAWFGGPGHAAGAASLATWLAIALAGCAVGFLAGGLQRDRVIGWSARTQSLVAGYAGLGLLAADRYLGRPLLGAVEAFEGGVVERGGGALGRALTGGAAWVRARQLWSAGGALGLAVIAIALGAVLFGLLAGSAR